MDFVSVANELWQAWTTDNMFVFARLLRSPEVWGILVVPFIGAVALTVLAMRLLPILERNLEKWLLIIIYLVMAGIIFVEVIRRFAFNEQVPWSTTVPAYLFLVLTWLAAAYSIKRRTQLTFNEVRASMPERIQVWLTGLDWLLWTGFSYIVVVTTLRRTVSSMANFQVMLGTDSVQQWWFYIAIPACWVLLAARAWMVYSEDRANYNAGRPVMQAVSVTDTE